jgi:hypothetical protein
LRFKEKEEQKDRLVNIYVMQGKQAYVLDWIAVLAFS